MWSNEEILQYLRENLKESRYEHTLGVVKTAKALAKINGVEEEKAELAALIHDSAKNMHINSMKKMLEENFEQIDDIEEKTPQLLHGKVAAIIGRNIMGIEDEEVLSAAAYHTTGKKNMTLLEKIIYIADYIEPNRVYPGVEELRKLTFEDLDKGVIVGLNNTINYILKQGGLIHPNTIEARNYLIINGKGDLE
ncbi:bis(5'-nucleosyl)-tetraphosphatase (symmetrical) YqeK [Clostridium intestinale]|uniref:bis(5'-nucleosyl)-tetraphosphatase (symmetrical) YqeK n=1 Tax=Clostridium intestinale TaxID=36845 RepID=UPI002DD65758|nr:bis(5'-nucleosyl)-tetraphosphatase (symmetrical) YqeK [Clostridium intestinale]WRY49715.1 bis(5'-nucleosyl)-tetraphosphatase (symmetrical) YqeK [Clostridium intestinale]